MFRLSSYFPKLKMLRKLKGIKLTYSALTCFLGLFFVIAGKLSIRFITNSARICDGTNKVSFRQVFHNHLDFMFDLRTAC